MKNMYCLFLRLAYIIGLQFCIPSHQEMFSLIDVTVLLTGNLTPSTWTVHLALISLFLFLTGNRFGNR